MIARLAGAARGAAAVELALVLPVFLTLVMGGVEAGHMLYMRNVLYGEVERAARASSLETAGAAQAGIDARVRAAVETVAPGATVEFTRRAFASYVAMQNPAEPFADGNGNHVCDAGEAFTDLNGNGHWDEDASVVGVGAARAVGAYDISVRFRPLFPPSLRLFGAAPFTVKVATRLRNQPYEMGDPPPGGVCS